MQSATNDSPPDVDGLARRVRAPLVGALVLLGFTATYWPTVVSIEAIWRRSATFAHGYLVIPIAFWLIWLRRKKLATAAAKPFWPALALVASAGLGWMLGRLADVVALEQFSLYAMMIGSIVAVLGLAICREIAFPLAFLVFAIPFGEFLVPVLMDRTADFTVVALQASGVPVFRQGNDLTIPSGHWAVVDACSGVRYLIASVMVGALYAYLCYRSVRKRLAFLAVSIIVPIVANWLRAYMIVMLGHLTNNRLAVGVDHLIYGWIFFGIVITTMFWIGFFWRDPLPAGARHDRFVAGTVSPPNIRPIALAALLALAAGAIWKPLPAALEARAHDEFRPLAAIPSAAGWTAAAQPSPSWTPHFTGARSELRQWFVKGGATVGLYVALYSGQTQGRELVEFRNQLVIPNDKVWTKVSEDYGRIQWDGDVISVREADIAGEGAELSARAWYWVDGRYTPSEAMAKALLAMTRMSLRSDTSAVIVIFTPRTDGARRDAQRLDRFGAEMGGLVMQALRRSVGA